MPRFSFVASLALLLFRIPLPAAEPVGGDSSFGAQVKTVTLLPIEVVRR